MCVLCNVAVVCDQDDDSWLDMEPDDFERLLQGLSGQGFGAGGDVGSAGVGVGWKGGSETLEEMVKSMSGFVEKVCTSVRVCVRECVRAFWVAFMHVRACLRLTLETIVRPMPGFAERFICMY